jgi:uncharacterized protein (DUF427 family)
MIRAIWNGEVLAESDDTILVERNHYFPHESVRWEYLRESPHQTRCPWKGIAGYYTVVVKSKENRNAAWYYPKPSTAAAQIAGRIAFWHGVRVEPVAQEGSELTRPLLTRLFAR